MLANGAGKTPPEKRSMPYQVYLCVLCILIGAAYPTVLDWAKSAVETTVTAQRHLGGLVPHTQDRSAYPFSSVSVVLINDALQLFLATFAVYIQNRKVGLRVLWADWTLVLKMVPLGAIYAFGELLTLRSVQKGSGPVYVVVANMKLVIAAVMSRTLFGPRWSMPWLHWLELVLISLAAAVYTILEAGASGSAWNWEGVWAALLKSSLVSLTSVVCEHTYKNNPFRVVLALQAFWGLMSVLFLISVSELGLAAKGVALELVDDNGDFSIFGAGPKHPLCASEEHKACVENLLGSHLGGAASCICLSSRGWDVFTLLAILADLSNAVSSALVFKNLSAVAKYICRAMSAVPMYVFYYAVGRSRWDPWVFLTVVYLCSQVCTYVVHRHRAEKDADEWTKEYAAARVPSDPKER
mmetsp:Transcript_17822/g.39072  ORF Transcript_17822/g.39072 Transcript_17822/m.39072 type:complete len:411 (+) Transcript_17822:49-1281(+)